jgi:hypothetical protein
MPGTKQQMSLSDIKGTSAERVLLLSVWKAQLRASSSPVGVDSTTCPADEYWSLAALFAMDPEFAAAFRRATSK